MNGVCARRMHLGEYEQVHGSDYGNRQKEAEDKHRQHVRQRCHVATMPRQGAPRAWNASAADGNSGDRN